MDEVRELDGARDQPDQEETRYVTAGLGRDRFAEKKGIGDGVGPRSQEW